MLATYWKNKVRAFFDENVYVNKIGISASMLFIVIVLMTGCGTFAGSKQNSQVLSSNGFTSSDFGVVRFLPASARHVGIVEGIVTAQLNDRHLAASLASDQIIRVWDLASGTSIRQIPLRQVNAVDKYAALAISIDGKKIAVAGTEGLRSQDGKANIYVFDTLSGRLLEVLTADRKNSAIWRLKFTADGQYVVAAGRYWINAYSLIKKRWSKSFETTTVAQEKNGKSGYIQGMDVSPLENQVALSFAVGKLVLLSISDDEVSLLRERPLVWTTNLPCCPEISPGLLSYSPNGKFIAVGSYGPHVGVVDAVNLRSISGSWRILDSKLKWDYEAVTEYSLPIVVWSRGSTKLISAGGHNDKPQLVERNVDFKGNVSKEAIPLRLPTLAAVSAVARSTFENQKFVAGSGFGDVFTDQWHVAAAGYSRSLTSFRVDKSERIVVNHKLLPSEPIQVGTLNPISSFINSSPQSKLSGFVECPDNQFIQQTDNRRFLRVEELDNPKPELHRFRVEKTGNSKKEIIKLDGWPNSGEPARAACVIEADGIAQIYIGSAQNLRKYDDEGKLLWQTSVRVRMVALNVLLKSQLVIALFGDGTIVAYDMQTGKEIIGAYFLNGKNVKNLNETDCQGLVTWIPEGFYDITGNCPPNGFGWSVSTASNYEAQIADIHSGWDIFFRPDILRAKLQRFEIRDLVGDFSITKAINAPAPSVSKISLLEPNVHNPRLLVPYTIKSEGGGIGEVLVLHNGKLIKSDGYYKDAPGSTMVALNTTKATSTDEVAKGMRKMLGAGETNASSASTGGNRDSVVVRQAKPKTLNAAGEYSDSVEIDVIPGEDNEITVMARNQDNTILGQGQTVRFKSSLPKADPHLWILPVGIASFQDSGVRKLASPAKDALDFACSYGGKEALKSAGINCDKPGYASSLFKSANIHVVDPLTNEKATRANILAKLDEIATKAKPTDTFIWFVSSHGTMDANSVYGIVPFDAKCQDPKCDAASGLVSSNDILEKSKTIKAMKQLLILDTCQAGGLDNKMSGLYDARMSGLAKNMGLHLYAAATATESALDGQDASKNSIFTATLLDGLAGASAKNAEGQISIIPLGQYVKTNTPEASRKAYADMTPQTPVVQHFGKDAPLAGVAGR